MIYFLRYTIIFDELFMRWDTLIKYVLSMSGGEFEDLTDLFYFFLDFACILYRENENALIG